MKKLKIKKNPYTLSLIGTWALSFLMVTVCYFTLHLPKTELLAQVQRQADESQDLVVMAHCATRQDMRQQMQTQLEQTEKTMEHFSVPPQNTTALVFEIGKIANDLGLSEFASKNQPVRDIPTVRDSKTVSEDWLEIEFKSSFVDFARFINRLERQSPAVFIERLTLRRNEDRQGKHTVKMELSFLVTHDEEKSVAIADDSAGANRQN